MNSACMIKSDLRGCQTTDRARQITSQQAWGHEVRDSGEAPSHNRRLSFQIAESKKDSTEANHAGFQRRNNSEGFAKHWTWQSFACPLASSATSESKQHPPFRPPRRSVLVGRDSGHGLQSLANVTLRPRSMAIKRGTNFTLVSTEAFGGTHA